MHFQIYLNKKKTNLHVSVKFQNKPFNRLLSGSSDRIYLNGKDKKMDTSMILVDLWRAFDTLEHGLSLKKLNVLVSGHLQLYLKIFVAYR